MPAPFQKFGKVLRERRLEKEISLRRFAEMIEVSPTYLSLIETGRVDYPPADERVRRMAAVLGADANEWLALAGRVPDDMENIILSEPEMPALLRTVKGMSGAEIRRVIEDIKKKRGKKS